ncbi:MAG TPA: hypothetical protein VGK61_01165 [Planctomycetota bacterium]|jgi:hypothetical protein
MIRLLAGAALLLAAASAPLALSGRDSAPSPAPAEVVSCPEITTFEAGPVSAAEALSSLDLRRAWRAFVGFRLIGVPVPDASRRRFVDAFFQGRLPVAAGFVAVELRRLDLSEAARIADRARSLDQALILLRPAPEALLRIFVERAEDPEAHREVSRAQAEPLAALVADSALGERAFRLLRTAGPVPEAAIGALTARLSRDSWTRAALASLGQAAAPALLATLDSDDPARRAVAAWVLAGLGDPSHVDRIIRAAVPELARDGVPGNAAFAIRALAALGDRARPVTRALLKSADDQVVAGALQVLLKTGGADPEDLEAARPRVERLAARAAEAGDEAAIGIETRAALGVARGAMDVAPPPDSLKPSQAESSGRIW